jgi:hypothetical protein
MTTYGVIGLLIPRAWPRLRDAFVPSSSIVHFVQIRPYIDFVHPSLQLSSVYAILLIPSELLRLLPLSSPPVVLPSSFLVIALASPPFLTPALMASLLPLIIAPRPAAPSA